MTYMEILMQTLGELGKMVIIAMIVESVWETLKMVWQEGKLSIDKIGALVVGLIIAVTVGFDILAALGFDERIPFVGIILTGILISRGGNFAHDLAKRLQGKTEAE
jgi:TRAP-type mannitol/chloroaromatic compound transport system permease small subunit